MVISKCLSFAMVNDLDILRRKVSSFYEKFDGIRGAVISDKDGVPVLQVAKEGGKVIDVLMRYKLSHI